MARIHTGYRATTTLGIATALCLGACQAAAPPTPDLDAASMAALEARDAEVVAALGSADWDAYLRMVTEDVVWMVPEATSLHGKAALGEFMAQFSSASTEVSNKVLHGSGNLAYRAMDYVMTFRRVGSDQDITYSAKIITVYRRVAGGEWMVEVEMWNPNTSS